jgi:hypothetical protein
LKDVFAENSCNCLIICHNCQNFAVMTEDESK